MLALILKTISITIKAGKCSLNMMSGISSVAAQDAAPITKRMLRMSAPKILPISMSLWPFVMQAMAVASSGRLVPNATSVAAMTAWGTPKRRHIC